MVLDVIPVNAFALERIPKRVVLDVVPLNVVPPSAVARVDLEAGGACLSLAVSGRARPTRRCSRPLRARSFGF